MKRLIEGSKKMSQLRDLRILNRNENSWERLKNDFEKQLDFLVDVQEKLIEKINAL